jgi:tetratricopeptide (TPR) repeat protein
VGWLVTAIAAAGLAAVYGQMRAFAWIKGDATTVILHPRVAAKPTIENLWWLLTHAIGGNWTPFSWYSHVLDHLLFGSDPGAHLLANVGYHALATWLVFLALVRLTEHPGRSLAITLLFAFHPLRVESVAWVIERKDVLSGALGALSLWGYANWARHRSRLGYLVAWAAYVLALLAKSMMITLPCVMLLLDHWPLGRLPLARGPATSKAIRRVLVEKLPFLPPMVFVAYMTRYGVDYPTGSDDPLTANAAFSIAAYVRKTLAPTDLSFWYPHPYLPPTGGQGIDTGTLVLSAAFVLATTLGCALALRKRPYLLVGWLWFVGMLVPVLGVYFQAGRQGMADRFTYFPSIGLLLAGAWFTADLLGHSDTSAKARNAAAYALVAALVALCGWRSHIETRRWRDTETVYADALAKNPRNTHLHFLLGEPLMRRGERERGLAHLTAAATLTPEWEDLVTTLANRLRDAGRHEEALTWYRRAYAAEPRFNHTRINLAAALAATGRHAEAIPLLQEAVAANPRSVPACINLGVALAATGQSRKALDAFDRALALDANSVVALRLSAQVLALQGDRSGAAGRLQRALRIAPADREARALLDGPVAKAPEP